MSVRVLVTGAAGFVGANLCARLLRDGHEVHALRHGGGDDWRLDPLQEIIQHDADLTSLGAVQRILEEAAPSWIFHLAAFGAYSWQTDAKRICATNLSATIELADAAERLGVSAFINAGSSSEYGFKDHAPDEEERPDPNSAYAVAKTAATMYCRHRARVGHLPAITLRLYSVYGALEDPRRLVPTLIDHGLQGRLPPLADPETARDFVHVDDVCDAFVRAAERTQTLAGGVYNIGAGRQVTLRELVACARVLMDIPAKPTWGSYPQRSWDTNVWYGKISRARNDLEWSATTSLEEGLQRTIVSTGANAPTPDRNPCADGSSPSPSGRSSATPPIRWGRPLQSGVPSQSPTT